MFQSLQESQLAGAIEAMLFVTDEPVGVITLADMLEVDPAQVQDALVEIQQKLAREERGVQLREVAGGWRLFTHPAYHELIEKYVISWDTRRLSQAALETLAVVAYSQPVTRAQVASVRGVNSDSSINSLVEKGLLREVGTADAPGNPVLYATTRAFLEKFGLRSVADLPDLDQFAPDDQARALIRERLSATRIDTAAVPSDFDDEAVLGLGTMVSAVGKGAAGREGSVGADAAGAEGAQSQPGAAASWHDPADDPDQPSPFAAALAQGLGLVEKIDFSKLQFETDDE